MDLTNNVTFKKDFLNIKMNESLTKLEVYKFIKKHISKKDNYSFLISLSHILHQLEEKEINKNIYSKELESTVNQILMSLSNIEALTFLKEVVFYNPSYNDVLVYPNSVQHLLLKKFVRIRKVTFEELLSVFSPEEFPADVYFLVESSATEFYNQMKERHSTKDRVKHVVYFVNLNLNDVLLNNKVFTRMLYLLEVDPLRFHILINKKPLSAHTLLEENHDILRYSTEELNNCVKNIEKRVVYLSNIENKKYLKNIIINCELKKKKYMEEIIYYYNELKSFPEEKLESIKKYTLSFT